VSIQDLFESEHKVGTIISKKSLSDIASLTQNPGILSASFKKYDQLLPNIDFSNPENFVKYGSAEKYYSASIIRTAQTFPIDGSKKEKINWRNNSSYLDIYLFDNEYPKNTGSITIGTSFGTASCLNNGYYNTPSRIEYIKIGTGLSTGSIYDLFNDRRSAFSFNSEDGFCIEFCMKQNDWSRDISTASFQTILDITANKSDTTQSLAFPEQKIGWLLYTTGTSIGISNYGDGVYTIQTSSAFSFAEWNHFSFNFLSGGVFNLWKNGSKILEYEIGNLFWPYMPVEVKLSGTIGALNGFSYYSEQSLLSNNGLGGNKFSGSFDDFRFWRRSRTDKEIASNWFSSIDGGYDSDEELNPDMGWYFKFNEYVTSTGSIDSVVTDYSGRKNHGQWIGYQSEARSDIGAFSNEIMDPIQHIWSDRLYTFLSEKIATGSYYDINNNGAIINNLPSFIREEDDGSHYANLTQIIASMFDRLFLQIQSLSTLKDSSYFSSGSLSSDILLKLINSNGLRLDNILSDYDLKESIMQKTDTFIYEKDLERIKEIIYKNIYNNLIYIFKSKGTEKSLKAVFRAFGVDDDVLKIKGYAKEGIIEIDGTKRKDTVRRKNFLDLYGAIDSNNMNGVVVNAFIPTHSGSMSYLTTSLSSINKITSSYDKTIECSILFPNKADLLDKTHVFLNQNNLSASLFGFYEVDKTLLTNSIDYTWQSNGYKFNVFSVQKDRYTKDAKFVFLISGSNFNTIYTESIFYPNIYNNTKWTFAFKLFNSGSKVSELMTPELVKLPYNNTSSVEICGYQEEAGLIIHSFSFRTDIFYTGTYGQPLNNYSLLSQKTKLYLGANRLNFTGNILYPTYAKFLNMRYWDALLSDEDIINHALDAHNFGISRSSKNWKGYTNSIFENEIREFVPKNDSLLLNWDFENEYIPNEYGIFTVSSFNSSSIYKLNTDCIDILGKNYNAIGIGFNSGSTVIDKNYVIEQKNRIPTDYFGYDDISLLDDEDKYFGRNVKQIEYFYTIENSIYDVISEDILNLFSSIDEFNNLYGYVIEKYRTEYKSLRLFRNIFFSKVQNPIIDVDKYISYYKWLDEAISSIISKLLPASANADSNIRNVIESHVLERNKYVWNSGLIKEKINNVIETSIRPLPRTLILRQ